MAEPGAGARWFDAALAATMIAAALAVVWLPDPAPLPRQLPALARWVTVHPANWFAYTRITEIALEAKVQHPHLLWAEAFRAAASASPARDEPRIAFVREGLFHWMELGERDRTQILDAAAPLLRSHDFFLRLGPPLFQLTGDLTYLVRNAPPDADSLSALERMAAAAGDFEQYRSFRAAVDRRRLTDFQSTAPNVQAGRLTEFIPPVIHTDEEPLVLAMLREWHRRPLTPEPAAADRLDAICDYALRHRLEPLDGLYPLIGSQHALSDPLRARLALHSGNADEAARIEIGGSGDHAQWVAYWIERSRFEEEHHHGDLATLYRMKAEPQDSSLQWRGTCDGAVCTSAFADAVTLAGIRHLSLALAPDKVTAAPYVEVYCDDARVFEGVLSKERTLDLSLPSPGVHPLEISVLDPFTARGEQRKVRILRSGRVG